MLSPLETNFLIPNATLLVFMVLVLLVIVVPIVAVTWVIIGRRGAKSRCERMTSRSSH